MNIDKAVINLASVLNDSRIETPNGPLTAREHQQLASDLNLLVKRAQKADELQKQIDEEKQCVKAPEMPIVTEAPDDSIDESVVEEE